MGLRSWFLHRKLRSESKSTDRLNRTLEEVLADTIKENKKIQQLANQKLKLRMIQEEQKRTFQAIEDATPDDDEEILDNSEDDDSDDEMKNLLTGLLINSSVKTNNQQTNGFPLSDTEFQNPTQQKNNSNLISDMLGRLKPEQIETLVKLADKYL